MRAVDEAEVKGRLILDWLDALERPLDGLISQVRSEGVVGSFAATIRASHGAGEPVDLSASLLTEGDQQCIGFTVHRRTTSVAEMPALPPGLSADLARLVERVGELSLPQLLKEASSLAEAHFIQRALRTSGGDPVAAALLLGVGRDRLVHRLHDGTRLFDVVTGVSDTE